MESEAEKNNLIKKWQDEVKIEEGKSTELWSPKKEGIMGTVDRQTNNNKVIIVDQKLYSAVTSNGPKNNTGRLDPQEKRTFADVASNNSSSGESSTNNQDEGIGRLCLTTKEIGLDKTISHLRGHNKDKLLLEQDHRDE